MSLHSTFNISQQALLLNQAALNVVGNNIANMNTAGYSKQRVDQSTLGYTSVAGAHNQKFQVGTGVQIDDIKRYRDRFLDTAYRDQMSDASLYAGLSEMASTIENSLNELGNNGLLTALSDFFAAYSRLTSNPADTTARMDLLQKSQTISTKFNQIAKDLIDSRKEIVGDVNDPESVGNSVVASEIDGLNTMLSNLANLNDKIVKSTDLHGNAPNNMLDERDKLLDQISQVIPIEVKERVNNSIDVSMHGVLLVEGNEANKFNVTLGDSDNPVKIQLKDKDGNMIVSDMNSRFDSGSIASYLQMGGNDPNKVSFQSMLNQVDKLAIGFATAVNDIQTFDDGNGNKAMAIGFDASGNPVLSDYGGLPAFFTNKDGNAPTGARDLQINSEISDDYWKIAAARIDTASATFDERSVGNGENAKLLSGLKNTHFAGLENQTIEGYLTNVVAQMGSKVEAINNKTTNQVALLETTSSKRQSVMGVNLDEELVDLVKYQRAYEASARVFNVANQIYDVIVNLGR